MGLWRGTKRALDWRLDRWIGLEFIQDTFVRTKSVVQDVFVPKKAKHPETFQDAIERLNLSEEDLAARQKEFTTLIIAFILIGFGVLAYGAYMLFAGHAWITLICTFLGIYAFAQAFRFHFWLFQIKHRKLGCTFSEWFNSEIHSSKNKKSKRPKE